MPLNIQTLNSTVNVVDSHNILSEEMMEQIIKRVLMRLQVEQMAAEQHQVNREIRDRMTGAER